MVVINNILLILIGCAFIVLMAGFFLVITRNMRQGRVFRRGLAENLETLRMGKMLRALGIDTSSYLHLVPISQINASMKKCEDCDVTEVCDDRLQAGNLHKGAIDFCPNQQCLSEFKGK